MPENYTQISTEIIDNVDDSTVHHDNQSHFMKKDDPALKSDNVNKGLDSSILEVPKEDGPTNRSKGKLKLDNVVLPIDDSIKTFIRSKKKAYKYVKYKENYVPSEFYDIGQLPRQSDQIKNQSKTTWKASNSRKTMHFNGKTLIVPSSIQAIPCKSLLNHSLLHDKLPALSLDNKHEELRIYHARLDLLKAIVEPEQSDYDW
jgi:hypothetical protein